MWHSSIDIFVFIIWCFPKCSFIFCCYTWKWWEIKMGSLILLWCADYVCKFDNGLSTFINEWIGLKNVTIFCACLKIRTGNALNITKERNSFSDFSWQRASLASASYLYLLFPVSTICSSNFLPVCIYYCETGGNLSLSQVLWFFQHKRATNFSKVWNW